MITFETQEEFDKAVMAAVRKYLGISVWMSNNYDKVETEVILIDASDGTEIHKSKDYAYSGGNF